MCQPVLSIPQAWKWELEGSLADGDVSGNGEDDAEEGVEKEKEDTPKVYLIEGLVRRTAASLSIIFSFSGGYVKFLIVATQIGSGRSSLSPPIRLTGPDFLADGSQRCERLAYCPQTR